VCGLGVRATTTTAAAATGGDEGGVGAQVGVDGTVSVGVEATALQVRTARPQRCRRGTPFLDPGSGPSRVDSSFGGQPVAPADVDG